jgi:hypothetical protein
MTANLDEEIGTCDHHLDPMRALIYAPPGLGKTSLAAGFPKTIFIQTEDGNLPGAGIRSFTPGSVMKTFSEVTRAIGRLYNDQHTFQHLAIDAIDALEPIVWAETCHRNGWSSIEEPGYGKGYIETDYVWRELLQALYMLRRDRRMGILLIGHSEVDKFNDPLADSYDRYDFRLHKRAHALIEDWVDAIFFINQDVTIKEEDAGFNKTRKRADGLARYIYTDRRPAFNAKNRYGALGMPDIIPYERGRGYEALKRYLPPAGLAEASAPDAVADLASA